MYYHVKVPTKAAYGHVPASEPLCDFYVSEHQLPLNYASDGIQQHL
jgi:hypothetical protein